MTNKKYNRYIMFSYFALSAILVFMAARYLKMSYFEYNAKQTESIVWLITEKINVMLDSIVEEAMLMTHVSSTENPSARDIYENLSKNLDKSTFTRLGVWDEISKTYYGSPGDELDINKYGFLQKGISAGDFYVTEPYRSYGTAEYLISVLIPYYDDNDTCLGVVMTAFPMSLLQEYIRSSAFDYPAEIWLINSSAGNIISCTDSMFFSAGNWSNLVLMRSMLDFSGDYTYEEYAANLLNHDVSSGIVQFSWNGTGYVQGYTQIEMMPDWSIAVNIGADTLTGSLRHIQAGLMTYAGIFVTLTVMLLIWIIIRQMRQRRKLKILSETDSLTGLHNKRSFIENFEQHTSDTTSEGLLLFMDVDDFKLYNDTYGHLAGDIVLKRFADLLKELFRDDDILGRYGGDEFIVFLKGDWGCADVEKRLNKLKERLACIEIPDFGTVKVTCSIGIARFRRDGSNYEQLCSSADQALYATKSNGKNGISWYTPD